MKQAFTLVELLVVITIISLVSVMSIGSFGHFIDEQSLQSQLQLVESDIKSLDRKVKNKEIFDYTVEVFANQSYYLVEENTANRDNTMELNLSNGTVKFNTEVTLGDSYTLFELDSTTKELLPEYTDRFEKTVNGSNFIITDKKYNKKYIFENTQYTEKERGTFSGNTFQKNTEVLLKVYKNDKLIVSEFLSSNSYNISHFSTENNYEIQATLLAEEKIIPLETIYLKQFSQTEKELLYLGGNIKISNIFGKKTPETEIELLFEQNGKETTISITP